MGFRLEFTGERGDEAMNVNVNVNVNVRAAFLLGKATPRAVRVN